MSLPDPNEHRGSPDCYVRLNARGNFAFVDEDGHEQCTLCFKCHTHGINKAEGCHNCGGPFRKDEELTTLKVANAFRYGIPAGRLTEEQMENVFNSMEHSINQMGMES